MITHRLFKEPSCLASHAIGNFVGDACSIKTT